MPEEDQVQNRMAEKPELGALRDTSEKPSWWSRTAQKTGQTVSSSTAKTILLAVTILIVLGLVFWLAA